MTEPVTAKLNLYYINSEDTDSDGVLYAESPEAALRFFVETFYGEYGTAGQVDAFLSKYQPGRHGIEEETRVFEYTGEPKPGLITWHDEMRCVGSIPHGEISRCFYS